MAFMDNRRADRRTDIMARVEATWVDSEGQKQVVVGMLEETSPHGARVRLPEPIRVGSRVTLKWLREQFSGTVRHIREWGSGYIVGIQRDGAVVPRRIT
jgi:hypothetical protein